MENKTPVTASAADIQKLHLSRLDMVQEIPGK
jgi:hypothetical protein